MKFVESLFGVAASADSPGSICVPQPNVCNIALPRTNHSRYNPT